MTAILAQHLMCAVSEVGYSLNLSISIGDGEETNMDSLSSGE